MRRGYDAPFPHAFAGRYSRRVTRCSCRSAGLIPHRALYQLSLVKTSEARRFVPKELPLVELFGCVAASPCKRRSGTRSDDAARSYTLGGLYLARYDSSPAGAFDEACPAALQHS